MAHAHVYVRCGCCKGLGRVEMTGEGLTTYRALRKAGETTGAALGRLLGVSNEAMCNRLAVLERHGLAASRRWGRQRLYRVARPGA